MELLKNWISTLCVVIVIISIAHIILPNSSIKKHYLRPEPERDRIPAKQVVRHLIIPPIYIIFVVAKF